MIQRLLQPEFIASDSEQSVRVFIYVYIFFLEVCLLHHDSSDAPNTKNPLKKPLEISTQSLFSLMSNL